MNLSAPQPKADKAAREARGLETEEDEDTDAGNGSEA